MDLRWFRSWPSAADMARIEDMDVSQQPPRVIDRLPRLLMTGHDYGHVEWPDDSPGFCLLEWDVALDPMARRAFAAEALVNPREVLAAPYRFHDTWCAWVGGDGSGPTTDGRPVNELDRFADYVGLGCIYLPRVVLLEFLARPVHQPGGFSDATFGRWYHEHYAPPRITWAVRPQHLHEYDA